MSLLALLLGGSAALLLLPAGTFFAECVAARRNAPAPGAGSAAVQRPRCAVLVPAHDEAELIGAALESALPQLMDGDRLLVVADNCQDDTADRARALGAEVVERREAARRGKGHALDFGLARLATAPPEVVVVLDADSRFDSGALARLLASAAHDGCARQASHLMEPPSGASPTARLSALAVRIRNFVRPLGLARLGSFGRPAALGSSVPGPAQLMGSGMLIPWRDVVSLGPRGSHLAEDLQLGIDLALLGRPARFVPEAVVRSALPGSQAAARVQRRRWEHGHLDTLLRRAPRLLAAGLLRRRTDLLALGLDLAVPPLALLLGLELAVSLGAAALALARGSALPLALAGVVLGLTLFACLRAWWHFGRDLAGPRELLAVPGYVLRKLPLPFVFLLRRQRDWVRTRRDP